MSRSKFSGAFDEIFRSEGIDTVRTPMLAADGLRNDQIAALACELPAASGVPLSGWPASELARDRARLLAKTDSTQRWPLFA
jgi:hypothetical protein